MKHLLRAARGRAYLVRSRVRLAWRALFPGLRFHYGDEATVHGNGEVNVEVDAHGRVVAVWFRCALLPFTQSNVGWDRVKSLRRTYESGVLMRITAIDFMRHKPTPTPQDQR